MRTARTAVAVASVVLMAGFTAACNSNSGSSDSGKSADSGKSQGSSPVQGALASLRAAAEQTGQKQSAKVEGDTVTGKAKQHMTGAMDWSDGLRAKLSITSSGGSGVSALAGGKPMPALYTPDAMYMNMGDQFASALGGKHWVKYGFDQLAKSGGAAGAMIKDQLQNNDPTRSVDMLVASGKVKKVGEESVKGAQATHYSGTVSFSELARMQSKDFSQADVNALQKQMSQLGMKNETIDVWVNSDHLLVKKREQASTSNGTFDSTVFYSDFGTKVTVTPPPASDTKDFADMQQMQ